MGLAGCTHLSLSLPRSHSILTPTLEFTTFCLEKNYHGRFVHFTSFFTSTFDKNLVRLFDVTKRREHFKIRP